MIQHVIEEALVATIIEGGEHAEGAVIDHIAAHIPQKTRQAPVKKARVHPPRRFFSPPPQPSSGSWQMGQRRGGRARGANLWAGRAGRLRPPAVPPDQSRGGCT